MTSIPFLVAAILAADPKPPDLPAPFATKSANKHPKVIGWPDGKTPTAPPGFKVTLFADGFDSPRWLYVLPNGDLLVAESRSMPPRQADPDKKKALKESKTVTGGSANRITLLRDADRDGKPEVREVFLANLNQPFGMCLVGETFFVANTDSVVAFPYAEGQTKIEAAGRKILDLPAGGYNNHWTRNLLASADGKKLYISVGSGSNVAEHGTAHEMLRACILETNLDGTGLRVFAGGLRNPVGMAWEPTTRKLWTAVNERDGLGDDLPPDYITSVRDGAFYGWPFAYIGPNEDPRRKGERPDLVAKSVVPDLPVGAHTASLGLTFYTGTAFPEKYRGGAFIGQRGSWNRSAFTGYRVAFVPFKDGRPAGPPEDFLTGFIANASEVHGRPVCVLVAPDGALLVTDDASNRIWRVATEPK
jgi:glucose/arabinose dehydrogenase